jgi:hypothetical protein
VELNSQAPVRLKTNTKKVTVDSRESVLGSSVSTKAIRRAAAQKQFSMAVEI